MAFAVLAPKSFDVPVAASQARSKAQEIVDHTRRQVEAFTYGQTGRRALFQILLRTQAELDVRLRAIPSGAWTSSSLESTMVLVREALAGLDPRFRDLLAKNHEKAAALGQGSTVDLLTLFEKRAGRGVVEGGAIRPLALREALAMGQLEIERHATSLDRYGRYMTQAIRGELQTGIVQGASFAEMKALLVGIRGPRGVVSLAARANADGSVTRTQVGNVPRGLFVERAGWAERIVRTEGMAALAQGANEEVRAQKARFPSLKRKLIETFDKRTAHDSYVAHGQVRDLDEEFFDGKHHYLTPPGRPNDRASLVPWRDEWAENETTRERTAVESRQPPAAPAKAVAPVPVQASPSVLTEGVHAQKVQSAWPAKTKEEAFASLPSEALRYLEKRPIRSVLLTDKPLAGGKNAGDFAFGAHADGSTDRSRTQIRATTARPNKGGTFVAGKSFSVSSDTPNALEAAKTTFVHEVGHHLHLTSGPEVNQMVLDAYVHANAAMTHVSRYARTDHMEYFAETFAGYVKHPGALQQHDPVGFDMVKRVLGKIGGQL